MKKLSLEECDKIVCGEAITLATVMAIIAIGISVVLIYKLFKSSSGSSSLPGGYKFEWK